jgi:hypothetical protein
VSLARRFEPIDGSGDYFREGREIDAADHRP